MYLKSKPILIKTFCVFALKHFTFDQENNTFIQVPIGILSIMEIFILTLNNLFINYEFIYVKIT